MRRQRVKNDLGKGRTHLRWDEKRKENKAARRAVKKQTFRQKENRE